MYKFYIYHSDFKEKVYIEDPSGWDGLGASIERDKQWHGVFFEYSPKLRFIKKGRSLLTYLYNKYGIECEAYLLVYFKNPSTSKFELDYRGRVNFSKIKISTLFAACNVENVGFIQKFKNAFDTKVDLTSDRSLANKLVNTFSREGVTLHSKTIRKRSIFNFYNSNGLFLPSCNVSAGNGKKTQLIPYSEIVKSDLEEYYYYPTQVYRELIEGNVLVDDKKYYLQLTESGLCIINANYVALLSAESNSAGLECYMRMKVVVVRNDSIIYEWTDSKTQITYTAAAGEEVYDSYTFNISESYDAEAADEIYFFFESEIETVTANVVFTQYYPDPNDTDNNLLNVSLDTNFKTTQCELLPAHEAWARVCEAITDKKDVFKSSLYGRTDSAPRSYGSDGEGSLRGITSGGLIRGIGLDKIGFNASAKDLFETFQALDGIGISIEEENGGHVVVAEKLRYFYELAESARFTDIKDPEMEVADQYYYNELEIGFKKWANEESNNLDEIASKRSYTFPITQLAKKLVLISPMIGSGYTLEYTRRDRFDLEKDRDEDNENFILDLARSGGGFAPAKNEDFTTLSNVLDSGSIYNAKLSISRNLLRNGELISASLYKQSNGVIRIGVKEGNARMISQLASESASLDESANINISQLSKPIWIPEIWTFKTKPTIEQIQAIKSNPRQYVSFSEGTSNFIKGYIIRVSPDQKTRETEFKLLRANL